MRQSQNKLHIEGWVNKIELENKTSQEGKDLIAGTVEVRLDETNIIPVEVFSYKYKKDGGENSIYKGLSTVKNTYTDATQVESWDQADKVLITNGEISVNEFVGKDNELYSNVRYSTNFINRVNNIDPKAEFSVEVVFQNAVPEIKNEDETGRGIINAFIINYSGKILPVKFVVGKKLWGKIEGEFEKGETLYLNGKVENTVEVITKVIEMEFGEDEEQVIKKTIKERLVTGIRRVDDERAYTKEDLVKAFKNRQEDIEIMKNKAKFSKQQDKDKGEVDFGSMLDDLPF